MARGEADAQGIAGRVRAARERLGWSREALAFHSGISWSGVTQVESGRRRNLRPDTLSALAAALRVTVDYLVRGGPASPPMVEHRALIYGSDEELVDVAGPFLAEGLERSEEVLAVTTPANIALLREHLGAASERVEFVEARAWYTTPTSALGAYTAFAKAKLEDGAPWIRILGEPVWAGRSDEEVRLWTRYESLLNLAFAAWPVSVLCPYDERSVHSEVARQARVTHPETIDYGGVAESPDFAAPGDFILDPL